MAQQVKYQGVDKESSGYKLLAAMGWQEGSGLGARQQGIKEHVKVKKKHDSTGVGAVEAIAKARDWTAGMAAYDLVLAKMKSVGAASLPAEQSVKQNKKKRKQPETPSDSSADTGIAAPAASQQANKPNNKKEKKRNKAKTPAALNVPAVSTEPALSATLPAVVAAPAAVISPLAEVKAQIVRARGRHVGRYHKTAAAKKAGSYSKSDLAAILGVDSFPTAKPIPAVAATASSSSDEQESSEDTTFQPSDGTALASGQEREGQSNKASAPEEEEAQEPQDGSLWWHGMFVKAGRMGNMASDVRIDSKHKVKINGFSEQDQETLYNVTQAGKSAGKKGLGKSNQGKPIGGAKWEGKKTLLEEEDEQAGAAVPVGSAEAQEAATVQGAASDTDLGRIKWKKLAKRAISAAGGKLKTRKLQKQLLQEAGVLQAQYPVASEQLMAQLASSKQFVQAGSSMTLSA